VHGCLHYYFFLDISDCILQSLYKNKNQSGITTSLSCDTQLEQFPFLPDWYKFDPMAREGASVLMLFFFTSHIMFNQKDLLRYSRTSTHNFFGHLPFRIYTPAIVSGSLRACTATHGKKISKISSDT